MGSYRLMPTAQDSGDMTPLAMSRSAAGSSPDEQWVPLTVLWEDSTPATGITSVKCSIAGNTLGVSHRDASAYWIAAPKSWSHMSIEVRGPNIEPIHQVVALAEIDVQAGIVVFVQPTVRLKLRVVNDMTRQPVANLVVELHAEAKASSLPEFLRPLEAISDEAGFLPFAGLGRRMYRVGIRPGSGYRVVAPASIDCAQSLEGDIVTVIVKDDMDWTIRGRVLAADSKRGIGGVALDRGGKRIALTDSDGSFVIPGAFRQQENTIGYGGDLICSATPAADCGYSPLRLAGPFPWGANDAVVELLPSRRLLRVFDSNGQAVSTAASWRQESRPTLLGNSKPVPQDWVPLLPSAGGGLLMPSAVNWLQTVWVRLDAPFEHAGQFMDVGSLRQTFESGAVVYEWVMPSYKAYEFLVLSNGRSIGGVTVEVLASVGMAKLQTAQAGEDCDPTTANPLTSNVARLLARGVTDQSGRCTMMFQATPNAQVRARGQNLMVAVQSLETSGATNVLRMTGAGGIRATILGSVRDLVQVVLRTRKTDLPMPTTQAGTCFAVRLAAGKFELLDVPLGTYDIFGMLDGDGNRPVYRLGEVEVVAGRITEFATTASPPEAVQVSMDGPDLSVGDRLHFVDTAVNFPVAFRAVEHAGQASVQLTCGSYRVLRYRRNPEVGSQPVAAVANETLVVGRNMAPFTVSFPRGPLQVRLLDNSEAVARVWVMVEGLGQVARTDDFGWFTLPVAPAAEFTLVEARLNPAGQWRPGARRWKGSLLQNATSLSVIADR